MRVQAEGRTLNVAVTVEGSAEPRRFNFENDIVPILSRFGCNSSGCHGKAEGQNGFKLSVFGFDPPADYAALTKEARGRRVFPAAPEQSLLLRKMTGQMPHGGGARIAAGSGDYETVRAWIAAGLPFGDARRSESWRRSASSRASASSPCAAGSSCASSPATPTAARST